MIEVGNHRAVDSDVISTAGAAMYMDRRHLLFAAGTLAITTSQATNGLNFNGRVSQDELDEAIGLHESWLKDINTGRRCILEGRDLSGLSFGGSGQNPVNLSGADFSQANLSETEADDILVHHCNFNGTHFDACHWRQPVFAYADMRRISAKQARWGTLTPHSSEERSPTDLSHAVLFNADLSDARICGFFYGTKLGDASLVRADLSFSRFQGPHNETSFSGAQLIDAIFHHCSLSSVSFFNADCSGADFSHAVLSDVRMTGCHLGRARFQGAEIERTTFSFTQMRDADFGTPT
jgi:uncharacterized protein YjbI with pentapeptide repeats